MTATRTLLLVQRVCARWLLVAVPAVSAVAVRVRATQGDGGDNGSGGGDQAGAEERGGEPFGQSGRVPDLIGAEGGCDGGHGGQAEGGADLVAGVDDAGGQAALLGRALEMAVPREGMNASDMPSAAISEAGRTSTQKFRRADERQPDHAGGQHGQAGDDHRLRPEPGDRAGAMVIIPIMISDVIGSSAAPLGKAV